MNTLITRVAARVVTPLAVVMATWLFLRGHVAIGGGFSAAVAIGLAAVFRRMTTGAPTLRRLVERGVTPLVGLGIVLMVAYGFAGLLWGAGFLHAATWHVPLPVVGELPLPSTLLFELAIGVAVMAVVVAVAQELGEEER